MIQDHRAGGAKAGCARGARAPVALVSRLVWLPQDNIDRGSVNALVIRKARLPAGSVSQTWSPESETAIPPMFKKGVHVSMPPPLTGNGELIVRAGAAPALSGRA